MLTRFLKQLHTRQGQDARKNHRRRHFENCLKWGVESLEPRTLMTADVTASLDLTGLHTDLEQYDSSRILVRFQENISTLPESLMLGTRVESAVPLVSGLHEVSLDHGVSVDDALAVYRESPFVLYAEPNYRVSLQLAPNDTNYSSLWGLNNAGQQGGLVDADIDASEAWNITTGNNNLVVAVIDTGVDYSHPELATNMWVNPGEVRGNGIDDDRNGYVDDVYGYDFANNDADPMDDNGHGTHVAGTIGARGNNGSGVVGVSWNTKIMALKFLDRSGSGYTSSAIRALDYAVKMGVKVSNNSWGGVGYDQSLSNAVSRAQAAGHIFVVAAGNGGSDGIGDNNDTRPDYPATFTQNNIITVAATDRNDRLASFSNYGAASVDLAAPGVSILSTVPRGSYSTFSGTSMAAPHVTGAIALLWSKFPTLTYRQVIDTLLQNTDKVSGLAGKMVSGGRLNIFKALTAAGGSPTGPPAPVPTEQRLTAAPNSRISDLRTTTSTITVNTDGSIQDLNVQVNISHTWNSDLLVTLRGPDGTTVTLSQYRGGSGDNYTNTIFDDQATQSIANGAAPFSGSYRADGLLSAFNGKNMRGVWQLSVYDRYRQDQGTLSNWSLVVKANTVASASSTSLAKGAALRGAARTSFLGGDATPWTTPLPSSSVRAVTAATVSVTRSAQTDGARNELEVGNHEGGRRSGLRFRSWEAPLVPSARVATFGSVATTHSPSVVAENPAETTAAIDACWAELGVWMDDELDGVESAL